MTYAQATYVDADGKKKKGTVDSSGELSYWEGLEDHYRSLYDEQVAQNNAAAASSTERVLQQIGEQIDALNEQYRESGKELYRGYRHSERKLGQQLSAGGYTGGLSETARLKLESGYQESAAKNERSRLSGVAELNAEGVRAQYENEAAAEKANAKALEEYYAYAAAAAKDRRSELAKEAAAMAETGDFSLYRELGYDEGQIGQLRTAWETKNPALAMGIAAREKRYDAAGVAQLSPVLAQHYLLALGYSLKTSGVWDYATENAYRKAFGEKSGRY